MALKPEAETILPAAEITRDFLIGTIILIANDELETSVAGPFKDAVNSLCDLCEGIGEMKTVIKYDL